MESIRNQQKCFIVFFLLIFFLFSCGGGGGSSTPIVNESASGIWSGTFTSNATHQAISATGIVTEDKEVRFITAQGSQDSGILNVTGDNVSGVLTAYAPIGFVFPDGSTISQLTFNGKVKTKTSIIGTYSGGGDSGTFTVAYNPIYERTSSLSTVSGNWTHSSTVLGDISMSVDAEGNISGNTSSGCALTGNINIINTSFNVYRVNINLTQCGVLNGNYSGLTTLSDVITTNDTLIMGISNPSASITASFNRQTEDTGINIKSVSITREDGPDLDVFSDPTGCDGEPEALLTREDATITIEAAKLNATSTFDPFPASVEECTITYRKAIEAPSSPTIESLTIFPNCTLIRGTNTCNVTLIDITRKQAYWDALTSAINNPAEYPTHYIAQYECTYMNDYGDSGTFETEYDIWLADFLMCGG